MVTREAVELIELVTADLNYKGGSGEEGWNMKQCLNVTIAWSKSNVIEEITTFIHIIQSYSNISTHKYEIIMSISSHMNIYIYMHAQIHIGIYIVYRVYFAMKDCVTRFRNDFLNKCGLTSSKYLFNNFAPRMAHWIEPISVLFNGTNRRSLCLRS